MDYSRDDEIRRMMMTRIREGLSVIIVRVLYLNQCREVCREKNFKFYKEFIESAMSGFTFMG